MRTKDMICVELVSNGVGRIVQEVNGIKVGFRCIFGHTPDGEVISARVTQDNLDYFDVTKDELLGLALRNSPKVLPMQFDGMAVYLGLDEDTPLYVLTNTDRMYGASVILYEGVLDEVHEMLGDFYILPSSVHEVLCCPKSYGCDIDFMKATVWTINRAVVSQKDYLSDDVLLYDGKLRRV